MRPRTLAAPERRSDAMIRILALGALLLLPLVLTGCAVAPAPGYYAAPTVGVYAAPRPYYYRPYYWGRRRW